MRTSEARQDDEVIKAKRQLSDEKVLSFLEENGRKLSLE